MTITEPFLAALVMGRRLQGKLSRQATPVAIAEFIVNASESSWLMMLRQWANHPPPEAPSTFQLSCEVAGQIVGLGYRPDLQMWWVMDYWTPHQRDLAQVLLIDLLCWVESRRDTLSNHERMMLRQVEMFLEILIGKEWRRRRGMIMTKYGGDERTVLKLTSVEQAGVLQFPSGNALTS